jgi:hypothetical protein
MAEIVKVVPPEIDLKSLNPDADGDGKVSQQEKEIYAALKAADIDGSGSIGQAELYAVIGKLVGEQKKVKGLSKLVICLILLVALALGSIFVVSIMAGEMIKESKVNGGAMTTPDGKQVVQVDIIESTTKFWDIPAVETDELAKMKDLVFYADLTTNARFGGWVEASYKVGGTLKESNDVATIVMTSGESVTIRRTAQTGELYLNGAKYPISDTCTGTCSSSLRRLNNDATPAVEFHPQRSLAERRQLRRGGFLRAGGNFCLQSSSSSNTIAS